MFLGTLFFILGITGGHGRIQSQVKQHTLRALDCRNPSKILTWDSQSMCKTIGNSIPAQQFDDITLIQEQSVQKLKAVRCNRKISRFVMYCGAYSHAKLSLPPDIMQHEVLSIEECLQLTKTNTYFGSKHSVLHVPMNSRRTVKYFEHGNVTFGAYNTECTGSDTTLNGERHTSVVVYVTATIELVETTLLVEGDKVVDTIDSVKLPHSCVSEKGCIGGENTYIVLETPNPCKWREICTIKGEKIVLTHDGTNTPYWVSKDHKMIIRKAGELTIQGCSGLQTVWETEYICLFVHLFRLLMCSFVCLFIVLLLVCSFACLCVCMLFRLILRQSLCTFSVYSFVYSFGFLLVLHFVRSFVCSFYLPFVLSTFRFFVRLLLSSFSLK